MTISTARLPLALYLHIPWCVRKCPYCDFNSHQIDGCPDALGYVRALLDDLAFEAPLIGEREVSTVFIGGGTPSLFPPEVIQTLLLGVAQRINLAADAEITMEANPGTFEAAWYRGYHEAGVNRLSIGVQSFNDDALQALGRIHSSEQAHLAIGQALQSGFDSVNIDLMFGLPGQSLEQARADLAQAIGFSSGHISYYQLTLEPNTLFHRHPPVLPEEDLIAQMHEQGQTQLAAADYRPYEVSAYARADLQCRHNLNYWEFGDYLGIGAGAHGKLSSELGVRRRWRVRHPNAYLSGAGSAQAVSGERWLSEQDLILEFMMNALRLRAGFSLSLFESRTGLPFEKIAALISQAEKRELLLRDGDVFMTTEFGRRYLNELLEIFCL
ncbi:MAG: radical SAM family heme chaperone HemW [Chromatiales bacterium]|nr:radical SAM family heme chaperone HemW [Chromatiales bacterium]